MLRCTLLTTAVLGLGLGGAFAAEKGLVELKDFKLKSAFADNAEGLAFNEGEGKIAFYTEGTATATVKIDEDGEYDIVVEASCDEADKMRAKMTLKVGDDVVKENFELAKVEAKEYTFAAKLKKGDAKLVIAFTNDAYKENEFDRNLYLHKVQVVKKVK